MRSTCYIWSAKKKTTNQKHGGEAGFSLQVSQMGEAALHAVVNVYSCHGDDAEKQQSMTFLLGQRFQFDSYLAQVWEVVVALWRQLLQLKVQLGDSLWRQR